MSLQQKAQTFLDNVDMWVSCSEGLIPSFPLYWRPTSLKQSWGSSFCCRWTRKYTLSCCKWCSSIRKGRTNEVRHPSLDRILHEARHCHHLSSTSRRRKGQSRRSSWQDLTWIGTSKDQRERKSSRSQDQDYFEDAVRAHFWTSLRILPSISRHCSTFHPEQRQLFRLLKSLDLSSSCSWTRNEMDLWVTLQTLSFSETFRDILT